MGLPAPQLNQSESKNVHAAKISTVDIEVFREYASSIVVAGWSSQVARRAHDPKVPGSNPGPAIKRIQGLREHLSPFFFFVFHCPQHYPQHL